MATYAKLIYNGKIQTVALIDGISPEEVSNLLKTVFGISGSIVGFMAEKGLVIPLSLVCKRPSVIPASAVCKILVSKPSERQESNASTTDALYGGNSLVSEGEVNMEDSLGGSEEDAAEMVIQEILVFLDTMKVQKKLDVEQVRLLRRMLSEQSTLLFAAYSVAVSANDSEYFVEICKDIANSLKTDSGRSACEAQDEVLQVCDQLYTQNKITESQLLYLRHLTLIRDATVAGIYDEFQEHESVPMFAKGLYDIAVSVAGEVEKGDQSRGNSHEEENNQENEDDVSEGLVGVVMLMTRAQLLTREETKVLLEMVTRQDDYVVAAYELYCRDRDLQDLQDTLSRCVRLEVRKRVAERQELELDSMHRQRAIEREIEREATRDDNDDDEEEDGDDNEDDDENDDSEDEDDEEEGEDDEFKLEQLSLESILSELKVDNIWSPAVPDIFIKTVFIATVRNQLSVEQAKALCDLCHAKYDIVHAAWEVFVVQKDIPDFVDTLRRIIRDLDLTELAQEDSKDHSHHAGGQQAEKKASSSSHAVPPLTTTKAEETAQRMHEDATQAKAEALQAIDSAKRELLKHSLDMMVKQQLVSADQAVDLFQRHLDGDLLTEAAIDSYANDRDVNEFIDTLVLLSSHTKEDLMAMMSGVNKSETTATSSTQPQAAKPTQSSTGTQSTQAASKPSGASMTALALEQVAEIVQEMLKNDMITPNIASQFSKLIGEQDMRLVAAYNQFMQTRNGTELIDSLLKVVIASVEGVPHKTAVASSASENAAPPAPPAAASKPALHSVAPPAAPAATLSEALLDKQDQKTVVNLLLRAQAINETQFKDLNILIDSEDAHIARVFRQYEREKDVYGLMDSLKEYDSAAAVLRVQKGSAQQAAMEAVYGADNDDDNQDDQDEDENENEDGEVIDEDDADLVENRFMEIIRQMSMTELEQTALRLAIAESDPSVRNAIDNFRQDQDENKLIAAMRNTAHAVITRTLDNARQAEEEDDEDNEDEPDDEDADYDAEEQGDEEGEEEDKQLNAASTYRRYDGYDDEEDVDDDEQDGNEEDNDEDGDEYEDEEGDDDDDGDDYDEGEDYEDPGASLITSKSARDHVFPILVNELMKESIISRGDGKVIMQQFAANNPAVTTALDRYDTTNDMAQLVDSLQQMVDNLTQAN